MGNLLQSDEAKRSARQYFSSPKALDLSAVESWSSENIEALNDLLRSLRRKKGFGLFFVQCSPAQTTKIIQAIQDHFPKKKLEGFELNRASEMLYDKLLEKYQKEAYEIACITGVEQALYGYEDTKRLAGWTSKEIYSYSWKGTPRLLNHLNQLREVFNCNLPIALIFFVPRFVIDYFVQRAPDFFDWRSGLFKFSENLEELKKRSQKLIGKPYESYIKLEPYERIKKILELKDAILHIEAGNQMAQKIFQVTFLCEQGLVFRSGGNYQKSLECYEQAININQADYRIWNNRGLVLQDLKRYEDAIGSYNHAISIDPRDYRIWYNRGKVLVALERYEKAVDDFDTALNINPSAYFIWFRRGLILHVLQKYQAAIRSFDHALEIKPTFQEAYVNREFTLYELKCNDRKIERDYLFGKEMSSYTYFRLINGTQSLPSLMDDYSQIERISTPNPHEYHTLLARGLYHMGLERYQEAIELFNIVLEMQPNYLRAWLHKRDALEKLGKKDEAYRCIDHFLDQQDEYNYLMYLYDVESTLTAS